MPTAIIETGFHFYYFIAEIGKFMEFRDMQGDGLPFLHLIIYSLIKKKSSTFFT